jgi:hypothetical protein
MVNPRVQKAIVHDNCGPTKKIADLARYKLSKDDAEDYLSVDHKILAAQLDQMEHDGGWKKANAAFCKAVK